MKMEWLFIVYGGVTTIGEFRLAEDLVDKFGVDGVMQRLLCRNLEPREIAAALKADFDGVHSLLKVNSPGQDDLCYSAGENPHVTARLVEAL